jgi:ABC-type lipopolysaccharide export system ATPase subunit
MEVPEVDHISKAFRNRKIPEDASFSVKSGSIVAIIVENSIRKILY